jgi:GDP-4-dehydro-6-deoxy-D-mannose reductase
MEELPQSLEIVELDIRNGERVASVFRRLRPDRVFHLAAQSYPTVSWEQPIETIEANVIGTTYIFEAIRSLRQEDPGYDPVVVSACSSAEYGASLASASGPVSENTELLPLHPYGVTKVATDLLTYQYFRGFGIRGKRARIFNTSGPRKRGDVISDFARRVAALPEEGGTLRVGNLLTRRAFLHVFDMVDALLRLSISGRDGEAYNISGTEVVSIGELLPMFEAASGKKIKPDVDAQLLRPTDEPIIVGDNSRIFADTGWSPKHRVADLVHDVYAYERDHRHAPEPA